MQPVTLISEIRARLDQLEAMLSHGQEPPPVPQPEDSGMPPLDPSQDTSEPLYDMFATDSEAEAGDDAVEEEKETDSEDEGSEHDDDDFCEVDLSDANSLIAADNSDNELENSIYSAVANVNPLVGITLKELSSQLDIRLSTVKRVTQEMFLADRLHRVHLRPIAYRVK